MCISMAKTIQEERWRWLKPIINKEMKLVDVAKVCPHSERSLKRWKRAYKDHGMKGLIPRSTQPKTSPKETPIRIKEAVISLRKRTGLCALKLHWRLKKEGLVVPERTIGKILKDEGLVKKYRRKKIKYKYIKAKRLPGELLEMDVKYVPGAIQGLKYYQYTIIDTATRWRHLEVFDEQTTHHSIRMMEIVLKKFPYKVQGLKTDNHSTFTNYYVGTNKRSDVSVKTIHALDKNQKAQEFFNDFADKYDSMVNSVDYDLFNVVKRFYNKHNVQSGSLLDAGCGTGTLKEILGDDFTFVGIDFSKKMLSLAEVRGYTTILGYLEEELGKLDSNSYDHVVCLGVLYFLEDARGVIEDLERIAKKTLTVGFEVYTEKQLDLVYDGHEGVRRYNHPYTLISEPTEVVENHLFWTYEDGEEIYGDVVFKEVDSKRG